MWQGTLPLSRPDSWAPRAGNCSSAHHRARGLMVRFRAAVHGIDWAGRRRRAAGCKVHARQDEIDGCKDEESMGGERESRFTGSQALHGHPEQADSCQLTQEDAATKSTGIKGCVGCHDQSCCRLMVFSYHAGYGSEPPRDRICCCCRVVTVSDVPLWRERRKEEKIIVQRRLPSDPFSNPNRGTRRGLDGGLRQCRLVLQTELDPIAIMSNVAPPMAKI